MTLGLDAAPEPPGSARVLVVVAHPDDEALWAGGLLASRPLWNVFILALCRGADPDRAPRFRLALDYLDAKGVMGDLDDGPDQAPLADERVQEAIRDLAPAGPFDLVLTHHPEGEYTRHLRHLEVALGVRALLGQGALAAPRLWNFAYSDQGGTCLPEARPDANLLLPLDAASWARKYALITQVYGFAPASWEARTTPRIEAFTCFRNEDDPQP